MINHLIKMKILQLVKEKLRNLMMEKRGKKAELGHRQQLAIGKINNFKEKLIIIKK